MSSFVYGLHAVKKMLQFSAQDCEKLQVAESKNQRLLQVISLAKQKGVPIETQGRDALARLAQSDKHQGCVLQVGEHHQQAVSLKELLQGVTPQTLLLILDGVQDPHNLGACLRSADAAGVDAVIIPKDRASGMTPVVKKVAAGAAESVPLITVTNLARSLKEIKDAGIWLIGASGEAQRSLYDESFTGALGLVMGAEGEGIRRLTAEACDYLVKLPMKGQVESLNVSVATGICLYELNRQRGV